MTDPTPEQGPTAAVEMPRDIHEGRRTGRAATKARPKRPTDLTLVERSLLGIGIGVVLTILLAQSSVWDHVPDLAGILPSRYVDMLSILPLSTNTALAFVAITGLTWLSLIATKHPVVPLSGVVAVVLGYAAYPYARILWHRIFLGGIGQETPGPLAWALGILLIAGMLVQPVTSQMRILLARYVDKGLDRRELAPIRNFILTTIGARAALATAFTLAVMIAIIVLPRLGTPNRFFLDNSIIVLLVAGLLVIIAVGFGAGIFKMPEKKA